jgi:hypothetical protein
VYQENWITDVVSALTAIGTGYLFTAWRKLESKPVIPLVAEGVVGVGALGTKHVVGNPLLHEMLEAVGYYSIGQIGNWVAEATTTFGGKGPGAPPVFLPGSASSSSSSIAVQRALAAARAAAAQRPAPAVQAAPARVGAGFGGWDAQFEGD